MRNEVKQQLEQITARNGHAVFPRRVILIDSDGDLNEQPERTIGILQDTQGCCGVLLHISPGAAEASLRQTIVAQLGDYIVDDQGEGLPILVAEPATTEDQGNAIADQD